MTKNCPECRRTISDNNDFCSAPCFKKYYDQPNDMPITTCLERMGRGAEINEENLAE